MNVVLRQGLWILTIDPSLPNRYRLLHVHEDKMEDEYAWFFSVFFESCPVCQEPAPDGMMALRDFLNA